MPLSWSAAIGAGIVAGVVATGAQVILWWSFTDALPGILFRDARLAAAILMGPEVLPPPATFDWQVMAAATFIHFAISIAYGLILAWLISRFDMGIGCSLLAGSIYGVTLYVMNMYGVTFIFPWFSAARDWITVVAHVVFGISLAWTYKALSETQ